MKLYNPIYFLLFLASVTAACSSDEPTVDTAEHIAEKGKIVCNIESNTSRTYYELDTINNVYNAKWNSGDQIAVCFDNSDVCKQFNISEGENTTSAVFYGPVPDSYKAITAVYPFNIFENRTRSSIEINMPSTITYDAQRILNGIMPMYAHSTGGCLNFYNLMSVMKISISGNGLLRSVTISSIDGIGLSGHGQIVFDDNDIPTLSLNDTDSNLTINFGAAILSSDLLDVFIPIPAGKYENGFRFEFVFEEGTEVRELRKTIDFQRAIMRSVKPYEIDVPFDFDNYETKDNEIWYKATTKPSVTEESESGLSVFSNFYSTKTQLGVITVESTITKIRGIVFKNPESVYYLKLPNTIQEIGQEGFKGISIETFEPPMNLRILGIDAFLGCGNLKRIVLNDGLEILDLQVFGDCPNLEYVYLPKSVQTIGVYQFRNSTSKLDHWEGDCCMIDTDRHALYANSAYGMSSGDEPKMIDIVAGCNLLEYSIPKQALYTQNCALSGCKNLKKLIIHENFDSFGLDVFSSLSALEIIICHAIIPPCFHPDEDFSSKTLKEIRVPRESIEQYKNAIGWKQFSDKILPI